MRSPEPRPFTEQIGLLVESANHLAMHGWRFPHVTTPARVRAMLTTELRHPT
jgi:hypothetical protein